MDSNIKNNEKEDKCDSFSISETELSVEETFHLLNTDADDPRATITVMPSVRPKAGQLYLFKPDPYAVPFPPTLPSWADLNIKSMVEAPNYTTVCSMKE